MTDLSRFLDKALPEPMSGCWLWMAHCNKNGYGQFFFKGRQGLAHRASYELFVAPIPPDLEIDHLCRNRCCVNPQHLEAVTASVNVMRGVSAQRRKEQNLTITHCPKGHPYEGENLRIGRVGERVCRTCTRDRMREKRRAAVRSTGRDVLPITSLRTHCPKGHPYEGENLKIAKTTGQRVCKECSRQRALAHYHQKKGNR